VSVSFDPRRSLIVIGAEISGPSGSGIVQLALDTGATSTLVNVAVLVAVGYDPRLATDRVQVTTGSRVEFAPRVELQRLTTLGQERFNFPVLAHTLPPSTGVDGLLGLDFFRGLRLTIDFQLGQLHLA
jgi:predicted aspartyl protease